MNMVERFFGDLSEEVIREESLLTCANSVQILKLI